MLKSPKYAKYGLKNFNFNNLTNSWGIIMLIILSLLIFIIITIWVTDNTECNTHGCQNKYTILEIITTENLPPTQITAITLENREVFIWICIEGSCDPSLIVRGMTLDKNIAVKLEFDSNTNILLIKGQENVIKMLFDTEHKTFKKI